MTKKTDLPFNGAELTFNGAELTRVLTEAFLEKMSTRAAPMYGPEPPRELPDNWHISDLRVGDIFNMSAYYKGKACVLELRGALIVFVYLNAPTRQKQLVLGPSGRLLVPGECGSLFCPRDQDYSATNDGKLPWAVCRRPLVTHTSGAHSVNPKSDGWRDLDLPETEPIRPAVERYPEPIRPAVERYQAVQRSERSLSRREEREVAECGQKFCDSDSFETLARINKGEIPWAVCRRPAGHYYVHSTDPAAPNRSAWGEIVPESTSAVAKPLMLYGTEAERIAYAGPNAYAGPQAPGDTFITEAGVFVWDGTAWRDGNGETRRLVKPRRGTPTENEVWSEARRRLFEMDGKPGPRTRRPETKPIMRDNPVEKREPVRAPSTIASRFAALDYDDEEGD